MAKIKIALEIENQDQLKQLERQLSNIREQVIGVQPEKIQVKVEPINRDQLSQLEEQLGSIRKQVVGTKTERVKVGLEPADQKEVENYRQQVERQVLNVKEKIPDLSPADIRSESSQKVDKQPMVVQPLVDQSEKIQIKTEQISNVVRSQLEEDKKQIKETIPVIKEQIPEIEQTIPHLPKLQPVVEQLTAYQYEKPTLADAEKQVLKTETENIELKIDPVVQRDIDILQQKIADIKEQMSDAGKTDQFRIEPLSDNDARIAEKRIDSIKEAVGSIKPEKLKDIKISQDQEEAVVALGNRIKGLAAGDLSRVRLNKEQLDLLKKMNTESRIALTGDLEGIKAKKENADWTEKTDLAELERANKSELVQEKLLSRRLNYIEGIQKAETRAFAEMDMAEKSAGGKGTILGGIATGAMQGMGLGGLMKFSGPLIAAYGAYKAVQFIGESMDTAGNFLENIDRLSLLTGQISDSAQKEIPMWRARAVTMGTTVNQSIELSKFTAETVGYTKLHTQEMELLAKDLKVRGRDVVRELPMLVEMMRRSPGMTLGSRFISKAEGYAGAAGIEGSRIYSQFIPMMQAYQNIMFSRGVEIPTDRLMRTAAGVAQFGESFRGEQGAQIMAGLSQTFMSGGGAGEAGKGLIYRAMMAKGMDYYGIQKAMSSGNVMAYMGDIVKEVQAEYGSIKPGTMGFLSLQALFPNLSIPQWERIMKNYKEGSPFDIKDMGNIIAKQGPDSKEEEYMKTYLKASLQAKVEKEIFQDAVASGIMDWWTKSKAEVGSIVNRGMTSESMGVAGDVSHTVLNMITANWLSQQVTKTADEYEKKIHKSNSRGIR